MLLRERLSLGLVMCDEHRAVRPVPRWNLVAPPELARDAPRLDVLEPAEVIRRKALRHEARLPRAHGSERGLRQLCGVDVPLVGQPRLDRNARTITMRHCMRGRLDLGEQALRREIGDDFHARGEAVHAAIGGRHLRVVGRRAIDDVAVRVEHVDLREIVALADLEVVE